MIRAASSSGGQSAATRASHPAAANAATHSLSPSATIATRGTTQATSACHPWSLSSYPTWSSRRRGNAEAGEPVRERADLGRDHVNRPGHVHAGGGTEVCGGKRPTG